MRTVNPTDMRSAITVEMAEMLNEMVGAVTAALNDYAATIGETAASTPVVSLLNGGNVLIEGAAGGAADFLRGRGYQVVASGDILLAKAVRRKPGRSKPKPPGTGAEAMALRSAKAGGHMEVYTETTDINTLRRLYQKAVGPKAAVSFNMFCQQVDDIGSMHRQLYGEGTGEPNPAGDDTGDDGEGGTIRQTEPPAPIGRGGPTVLASTEHMPTGGEGVNGHAGNPGPAA